MSAPKLERNLGALPMLAISTGAIIGSAWLFAPMFVAQVAGPGAIFTWLIAIGVSLLLALDIAGEVRDRVARHD